MQLTELAKKQKKYINNSKWQLKDTACVCRRDLQDQLIHVPFNQGKSKCRHYKVQQSSIYRAYKLLHEAS